MTARLGRITRSITFTCEGRPVPQGNHTRNRAGAIYDKDKGLATWRTAVRVEALQAKQHERWVELAAGAGVQLELAFFLIRPPSTKRAMPTVRPDLDKLVRGVGDSLTRVLYHDDGQIVSLFAHEYYATHWQGVEITVAEITSAMQGESAYPGDALDGPAGA